VKPVLVTAITIVNLALLSYSIGIISEQLKHKVTKPILGFLTVGVILDITATICMIIGSESSPFSLHGILGYSSLTAMIIDTSLIWRHRLDHSDGRVPRRLHLYSRIAYTWWVLAYITGGALVAFSRT